MLAIEDNTLLPFSLPTLDKKKVTAAFDGGMISSDGGVLLLAEADTRLGRMRTRAGLILAARDPAQSSTSIEASVRERVLASACGYPDGKDLDSLRLDPAFKMACGRLPESGGDLASQPTLSRLENAPTVRDLIRISRGMVKLWCESHKRPPKAITLDIDDTPDTVHGHQQLALFNAHYDERCFSPIHIYDAASGHCVVTILRPGKTPDGKEVRAHVRRLVREIRGHWPNTTITIRGDSHYGRKEAMDWCEQNNVRYVFGFAPNKVLADMVFPKVEACCLRRVSGKNVLDVVRDYTSFQYAAKSWSHPRRNIARIEVTNRGADTRYIVTNIVKDDPEWMYDWLYCARGQAENLIKRHKSQLASDRTSCRSPLANQFRLILHTAAYWLMRTLSDAIPQSEPLARGDFSTIRLRLLKVAVRVRETGTRIKLAFAANCPDAALFRDLIRSLVPRPA